MEIVYSHEGLADYLRRELGEDAATPHQSPEGSPSIFLDRFLEDSLEVDVDALCDGSDAWIGGIMQHVEEAGVHSGDSACVLPPHSLGEEMLEQIRAATRDIATGDRRRRADQRAVRDPSRRAVCDRGQSARIADRAVRLQGRRACRSRSSPAA